MPLPPLPRRREDCWVGGFVLDGSPVHDVRAAGGLVVTGGKGLSMVRPGAQNLLSRGLPSGIVVRAVAVEPWAPRRFAIAARGRLTVFEGHAPDEPSLELKFDDSTFEATHLAWTRNDGRSMIYYVGRDGEVGRLWVNEGTLDSLDTPPVDAIASDGTGVMAMLSMGGGDADAADVWISQDGKEWRSRTLTSVLDAPLGADGRVHLAVCGDALAYSVGSLDGAWGTHVSWDADQDLFEPCDVMSGGPVAFQSDEALFATYNGELGASILRLPRGGAAERIAQIGGDEDHLAVAPRIE
ncbi:MAG: hypothetical protein ACRELB_18860, partial [Polyangiaceae bacterium]